MSGNSNFHAPAVVPEEEGHVVSTEVVVSNEVAFLQAKAEIDHQVATARAFPRSITSVRKQLMDMVGLSPVVAEQCTYILPRGGKKIEGASVRFAEILISCWGNAQAAARVSRVEDENIVAQAVFFDLEKNVKLTYEVARRITNREGKRYDADMIAVTGNAACSIAMRNAVLHGIPKAFWQESWEKAKLVARGDEKSLNERRGVAMARCKEMNIPKEKVFEFLGVKGVDDVSLDHLAMLAGVLNAIKEGSTTVDEAFTPDNAGAGDGGTPSRPKASDFKNGETGKSEGKKTEAKSDSKKTDDTKKAEPENKTPKRDLTADFVKEKIAELGSRDKPTIMQMDDNVRGVLKNEERDDLLQEWSDAYEARLSALEEAADPKKIEYREWKKEQFDTVANARLTRTLDELEDMVTPQLRDDDKKAFKDAIEARAKELRARK